MLQLLLRLALSPEIRKDSLSFRIRRPSKIGRPQIDSFSESVLHPHLLGLSKKHSGSCPVQESLRTRPSFSSLPLWRLPSNLDGVHKGQARRVLNDTDHIEREGTRPSRGSHCSHPDK